ncbi:MAG: lipoprotein [Chlorobi bacterium]|nr:lipoprotein [Chlorobiota bacterium]
MMRKFTRFCLMAGSLLATAIMGSSASRAQLFEYTYGGPSCAEAGRGGAKQVSTGGYIAAGETYSTSTNCVTSDIYLVRTNNDGSLAWSMTYNIGKNDSATDVEEVLHDPSGNSGYVITGVTDNSSPLHSPCAPSRDVFILRVDKCGAVIWVQTYGRSTLDEIGYDIVEATTGTPTLGTNIGDFVVAGSATNTTGRRDGYVLRVKPTGGLIWDQTYDSPNHGDDYWYALDEASLNVPAGRTADIIMAGGTNGYSTTTYDAWMARVDGTSGRFTAAGHTAVAHTLARDEDLRSVQQIRTGTRAGEIVAVGRTGSTSLNMEVLVLETKADVCSPIVYRTLGDNSSLPDEGYCVREIPAVAGPVPVPSHIIITGYVTPPVTAGFGGKDAFAQEYVTGTLTPVAPVTTIYGGGKDDWGWSISPVTAVAGCTTAGFIMAGFTKTPFNPATPNDPQQLYLVKSDVNRKTGCERTYAAVDRQIDMSPKCALPFTNPIGLSCQPPITRLCETWQFRVCFNATGTTFCPAPACPACIAPAEPAPAKLSSASTGSVVEVMEGGMASYPNPIKRGGILSLQYNLREGSQVNVSISDLVGREVYNSTAAYNAGTSTLPVNTTGWSAGAYVIKITAGGSSRTTRIIVTE